MAKTDNLTIRVDPDLKERAERLRKKYFKRIPLNIFLEIMLEYGMDVQERIGEYGYDIHKKSIEETVNDYFEKSGLDENRKKGNKK
jgi:hypothetical protein